MKSLIIVIALLCSSVAFAQETPPSSSSGLVLLDMSDPMSAYTIEPMVPFITNDEGILLSTNLAVAITSKLQVTVDENAKLKQIIEEQTPVSPKTLIIGGAAAVIVSVGIGLLIGFAAN